MNKKISIVITLLFAMSDMALASAKAHWGYEGHEGPAHWAELSHDYYMCTEGKQQSPINITAVQKAASGKISLSYKATAKEIINNGHTIQVNMNEGSSISVDGKSYKLLQFHFHSPSEHQVNGVHADMVAHFVHQAADGQLAVIGVLFNKGNANAALAKLWNKLPTQHDEKQSLAGVELDVSKLLPAKKAYYNYPGSLTTPPCSEGVNWLVLQAQGSVSAEQVDAFRSLFAKSIRPVQGINGREIKISE